MARQRKTNYGKFAQEPADPNEVIAPANTVDPPENQNEVQYGIVKSKRLNQRIKPDKSAKIMGELTTTDNVEIISDEHPEFYKVQTELGVGYCMKQFIDLAE